MAQLHLYMRELIPKVIISVHNCCMDQKGLYQIEFSSKFSGLLKIIFSHFFLNCFHILKQLTKPSSLKKKKKNLKCISDSFFSTPILIHINDGVHSIS